MPIRVPVDREALGAFCRQHQIAKLSFFGSVTRDDFDPGHSDVDVLVEFIPGARRSLFKLVEMQKELSHLLGREVDLTTPGSLSKYFRDDVLAAAEVLYDAA